LFPTLSPAEAAVMDITDPAYVMLGRTPRRKSSTPSRIQRASSDATDVEESTAPCHSPLFFDGKQALHMGVNPAVADLAKQLNLTPSFNGFHAFALDTNAGVKAPPTT
jgi:hypothetical protein